MSILHRPFQFQGVEVVAGAVASILPGILLGAVQCAIADYKTNHNLVADCLQLCAQTICLVMNDDEYDRCCGKEEDKAEQHGTSPTVSIYRLQRLGEKVSK